MTTLQMNIVTILRGKFTTAGNFTGRNAANQRIHIPADAMTALKYNADNADKIPYPLTALVVEGEYDILSTTEKDEQGNPAKTGEKFQRLEAGSIFLTKAEAITAYNADSVNVIEAKADLKKVAVAAGLSEASLKALEAVSV